MHHKPHKCRGYSQVYRMVSSPSYAPSVPWYRTHILSPSDGGIYHAQTGKQFHSHNMLIVHHFSCTLTCSSPWVCSCLYHQTHTQWYLDDILSHGLIDKLHHKMHKSRFL